MPLITRKKIGLFKAETTYNTNPTPAVATDAILLRKLDITPLRAETASRDLIRPFFGASDSIVTAKQAALSLEMELAGTPSAGVAFAPLSALMLASGMAQTIVASTSVTYNPVSSGISSLTSLFNLDGVQHAITGARSNFKMSIKQGEVPTLGFDLTGNFNTPTSVAQGTPTYTQRTPVSVSEGNTTLSLFGVSTFKLISLDMDLGNQIETIRYANSADEVIIVHRKTTAKLVLEAVSPTVRNFFNDQVSVTTGALSLTLGAIAGNKVEIAAPRVSITGVTYGDVKGAVTVELDLVFTPNTGNDDFTLKFF
jgi:hypothetical protein